MKAYLARIDYRVEVWSFDQVPAGSSNTSQLESQRDLIYSTSIKNVEDPVVLVQQEGENEQVPSHIVLLWEIELFLSRPRTRMSEPSIHIHSLVNIRQTEDEEIATEVVLTPFEAAETNVLEPLHQLPGWAGSPPYLAASRLKRVVPPVPKPNKQLRLEHMSPKYRVVPATMTRMRYTRLATPSPLPTTIASLDVDIIPFMEIDASIEEVDVTLVGGAVENFMAGMLPIACHSRDSITFLYRLHPSQSTVTSTMATPVTPSSLAHIDVLSITMQLRVKLSDTCTPLIRMEWTTNVDFFQALNPSFGAPSQPIQRRNRPSSLPLNGGTGIGITQAFDASLQPARPLSGTNNVTVSFTAPARPVTLGKPFSWQLLIVNQSKNTIKYAIIPLTRIPRNPAPSSHFAKRHAPKSSTASFHPTERRHAREGEADVDFAQAVVDENVVYAMQHSSIVPPDTDLMALTAEIRVGPLGPNQCHEGIIEMVAFKEGTLRVDAIRVIDLAKETSEGIGAPGVMMDIRDLPDVIVRKEAESNSDC